MDDETRARRDRCERFLNGDGPPVVADLISSIGVDVVMDEYGEGGVVADLERSVAGLLGHEAAAYLPSGTMAQAATLRIHADVRATRTVLWHPACHLDSHEGQAHSRLHQLVGRPVGEANRLVTLDDLAGVAEPVAALLLELPQRDLGGELPDWADLQAQITWARDRGAAVHLDGARLWEATAGYDQPPAEIAALFDTAYVSFYKGIGALAGCCLVGPSEVVGQLKEWRRRLGGTLHGMWPGAASAMARLPERLAEMPARMAHARAIAAALAAVDGVTVLPDPPQAPMMHLLFAVDADTYAVNARRLAEEMGVWVWPKATATGDPHVVRCELGVGRATCGFTPDEVVDVLTRLTV